MSRPPELVMMTVLTFRIKHSLEKRPQEIIEAKGCRAVLKDYVDGQIGDNIPGFATQPPHQDNQLIHHQTHIPPEVLAALVDLANPLAWAIKSGMERG